MLNNLLEDLLKKGDPVQIENLLRCYIAEALGTIIFGYHLNFIKKEVPPVLVKFLDNISNLSAILVGLTLIPLYRYFNTPGWKRLNNLIEDLEQQFAKFIEESNEVNKGKERHDAMAYFLGQGQSIPRATKNASNLYSAGMDSTRFTILWALYNLGRAPEVQEKLRHEVLTYCPTTSTPLTPEILKEMKYLRDVMKESHRVTPSGIGVARELLDPSKIQGYEIPKGVTVYVMQRFVALDERYFPQADQFKPERWTDKSISPWYNLPFGFGPRMCQGIRLADIVIYTLLVRLVQNYRWKIEGTVGNELEFFVKPDRPLPIKFELLQK